MSSPKFSFIGVGNMGAAVLTAACSKLPPENITICDKNIALVYEYAAKFACKTADTNTDAAADCDYLLLFVKPHQLPALLTEIAPVLDDRRRKNNAPLLVSFAAGVTIASIRRYVDLSQPVMRVMPNTPALVAKGLMIISGDGSCDPAVIPNLELLLKTCGETMYLDETLMNQATTAAACSPAFVYMMIDALSDAAVLNGLSRADAKRMSAQAVLGAAAMVLESGISPGDLKDMVCSPGGSTIRGVAALERSGFRAALIDAFNAAYERNTELGD